MISSYCCYIILKWCFRVAGCGHYYFRYTIILVYFLAFLIHHYQSNVLLQLLNQVGIIFAKQNNIYKKPYLIKN